MTNPSSYAIISLSKQAKLTQYVKKIYKIQISITCFDHSITLNNTSITRKP
uniref:Uncharacterized protein n=1 Tax=Siphoviridae sp. ctDXu9 TaxID=2825387 RepID=A0A8S5VDC1_9CAUD|nr:MAG TPA: hypothetical protein [Siphoviridae sp. ctDXu9]